MISAYRVTVTNPDPLTIRRYRIEASTRAQACEIGIERARQELPSWIRFGQVLRAQAFPIRTREKYRKMIKLRGATENEPTLPGHWRNLKANGDGWASKLPRLSNCNSLTNERRAPIR